jgi:cysteine desulfurase
MTETLRPIYLDHQATTPVDARALAVMLPFFSESFGNPASKSHPYGWIADEAVAKARAHVAALVGAEAREVVFTSGATESVNLALKGVVRPLLAAGKRPHIVTAATEHKATLDVTAALEREGARVTVLPVQGDGTLSLAALEAACTDDTALVSLMHANNEIGTIHDVAQVGAFCRERGILFHADAAQSASTLPLDVVAMQIDLLSLSAHKMYGPKGVGALVVKRGQRLQALIDGGGHERGHRSGTLNVPGIVGFGEAARLARDLRDADRLRLTTLRDRLFALLDDALPGLVLHGAKDARLAGNLSLAFPFVEAEALLLRTCREVALSTGSACTQASLEPSHVLRAIRVPHDRAHATVRIGIGRHTSDDDIVRAARVLIDASHALQHASPIARAAHSLGS